LGLLVEQEVEKETESAPRDEPSLSTICARNSEGGPCLREVLADLLFAVMACRPLDRTRLHTRRVGAVRIGRKVIVSASSDSSPTSTVGVVYEAEQTPLKSRVVLTILGRT
jgi:hypothetical protein